MRTQTKRRHARKRKKYTSKYFRLYGYSIKDICKILGWSYGTVHAHYNNKELRKSMLEYVKVEEKGKR